jgi:hypothetical protein
MLTLKCSYWLSYNQQDFSLAEETKKEKEMGESAIEELFNTLLLSVAILLCILII